MAGGHRNPAPARRRRHHRSDGMLPHRGMATRGRKGRRSWAVGLLVRRADWRGDPPSVAARRHTSRPGIRLHPQRRLASGGWCAAFRGRLAPRPPARREAGIRDPRGRPARAGRSLAGSVATYLERTSLACRKEAGGGAVRLGGPCRRRVETVHAGGKPRGARLPLDRSGDPLRLAGGRAAHPYRSRVADHPVSQRFGIVWPYLCKPSRSSNTPPIRENHTLTREQPSEVLAPESMQIGAIKLVVAALAAEVPAAGKSRSWSKTPRRWRFEAETDDQLRGALAHRVTGPGKANEEVRIS